jgi:enoyl-CoA hydratase
LIDDLEQTGSTAALEAAAQPPSGGTLEGLVDQINTLFAGERLGDILTLLDTADSDFARDAAEKIARNSPLSMACTVEMMHRLRGPSLTMEKALDLEYRFTFRASEHADFIEGIRAAIIDKDRSPKWQFADMNVPLAAVSKMLQPLGASALKL